jgi:hypothetical protein
MLTGNKFIMDNVSEFISPNFHEPMVFTWLLFGFLAVSALSRRRLAVTELLVMLFFTYMALYSARYIPLFAMVIAPIAIRHLEAIDENAMGRIAEFMRKRAVRLATVDHSANSTILILLSVFLVIILAAGKRIEYGFDKKIKPVEAVEFLRNEPLKGHMFNNDEFGDYIIYAAWPGYKVFFDGRSDMYGSDRMKEYFKLTRLEQGWGEVISKYDIGWIIYNTNSALSSFLLERNDWKLIYSDKVANIFVKNSPENQYLVEKYRDVKPVVVKEEKE